MQAMLVTNRIEGGTAVPEVAVKFVHSVGVRMEVINGERGAGHLMLTSIAYMLNVMTAGGMRMIQVTVSHQVVHLQVFCDGLGLEGLTAKLMIAIHLGFAGNAIEDHVIHVLVPITGQGNGPVFEWVESC